ncbi:hypothetical protein [Psychrobacter sp. FDAARGOS_221]|uniref:hypothetical protein n=1 Tax=Psychrobacter sp. FDAARGOS_221 TaxID=1975705 RepID=UPI000BB530E8|nr:hypothetical protein [Psychrobacter sp. FDAARGOS_221]PNK59672.1 hypothetical protein A6J60_001420 [Psychrobacter sp. FDAARGOS_221]
MRFKKPLAALFTFLVATPSAYASLESQLEVMDMAGALLDYYPSHDEDGSGVLTEYQEEKTRFMLTRNETYSFAAVCDDDCTDIDLYVYDNNDKVVDLDDEDDDHPVVSFTAEYSGPYYAEVTMYECATKHCAYKVRAYKQTR